MINAIVDGTTYTGIEKITTGGKTINLQQIGGEGLPEEIGEIKVSTFTQTSDSGVTKTFPHGCSMTPDIVIITSDYKTYYTSERTTNGTVIVHEYYNSIGSGKMYSTVYSGYKGSTDSSTSSGAGIVSDNDGNIIAVDDTNVTIKSTNTRRIGGGLTYTMYAIVLNK